MRQPSGNTLPHRIRRERRVGESVNCQYDRHMKCSGMLKPKHGNKLICTCKCHKKEENAA
jgi:hypothetical protein